MHLLGDALHDRDGNPLVVRHLDEGEKVVAQHLAPCQ